MYHALTHTFASHRLLRHLARGLVALGEYEEAGKALELYRELWEKSRETDPRKVARELRRFRREGGSEGEKEKVEVEEEESEGEDDFDDARQFVGVAVFAVRVFCRYLGRPERGLIFARRAREELDKEEGDEGLKADKVLEGRVEEALGVAIGALAAKGALCFCLPDTETSRADASPRRTRTSRSQPPHPTLVTLDRPHPPPKSARTQPKLLAHALSSRVPTGRTPTGGSGAREGADGRQSAWRQEE